MKQFFVVNNMRRSTADHPSHLHKLNQGDRGSGLSAMTNKLFTSNHSVISGLTRDLPLTLINQ